MQASNNQPKILKLCHNPMHIHVYWMISKHLLEYINRTRIFYTHRNIIPNCYTISHQAKFPHIMPCKSYVKLIWLPFISNMNFTVSLKEAINHIWHIITVMVHECTHIPLTDTTSLQQEMVYCVLDNENILQFHQPWLVIRTFHRQGRCSRGGHLCNEHSEVKYSCSYK